MASHRQTKCKIQKLNKWQAKLIHTNEFPNSIADIQHRSKASCVSVSAFGWPKGANLCWKTDVKKIKNVRCHMNISKQRMEQRAYRIYRPAARAQFNSRHQPPPNLLFVVLGCASATTRPNFNAHQWGRKRNKQVKMSDWRIECHPNELCRIEMGWQENRKVDGEHSMNSTQQAMIRGYILTTPRKQNKTQHNKITKWMAKKYDSRKK